MIRVEGHKNLYRDEKSGAIINCDSTGYSQYKKSRHRNQSQKSEIDRLRSEIDEIKSLLGEMIKKNEYK
jgi:hypothetical protein|tara:strand:- start:1176 stop:1382 length:207 start_codon:yes stop_codon:yes gene_type:complete